MKKKNKKKPVKTIFVQDWGTYPNQTLVCLGAKPKEILAYAKRIKAKPILLKWLTEEVDKSIKESIEKDHLGFFMHNDGRSILWLREFTDNWDFYGVLLHELHHAVFVILGSNKKMEEEIEAQAYQFEYLFQQIRRKIQKVAYRK